jgi:hypothetical protein
VKAVLHVRQSQSNRYAPHYFGVSGAQGVDVGVEFHLDPREAFGGAKVDTGWVPKAQIGSSRVQDESLFGTVALPNEEAPDIVAWFECVLQVACTV